MLPAPGSADAQPSADLHHPLHPQHAVVLRGHVFVGGYFYDPFFGPYPWWPRTGYPYWYFPVYGHRSDVRLRIAPEEAENAAVYIDGFYAGVVDDFNSIFQALPLTPGGHAIVLYLEGFRTVSRNVYLRPGSTFNFRETMQRLSPGETSEPPELAPAVPAPPPGTYRTPVTPPPPEATANARSGPSPAVGFGVVDLYVQPATAEVKIDGQRWVSSDDGHYVVQVPAGKHRVEVGGSAGRQFAADIEVREGESTPLNVSLVTGT
jgi:hypothetical protein